ncbi:MAG: reverse transcriptase domain-containing protein, partial [Bacteroidota bacterium]
MKVEPAEVQERWKGYFEELLNRENPNTLEEAPAVHGPLELITVDEVSTALKCMKSGKAAGPSEVITEMFKIAGDLGTDMLCSVFNRILSSDTTPVEWAKSITVPLYKGKGDALDCGKYRGLRLLEHGMKIWERILMCRLEVHIKISPQQFGFAAGKSTTDAIFIARQLQEKYLQNKKELYHIFVDLEKAFDKVPRQAISWALRRQMVPEYLVKAVMGLYTNSMSQVKFAGGLSEEFPIRVGVHQGSALSPLLFKIVMEEATKDVRIGDPWELLYADDLVLTAESRDGVLKMFNDWSRAMELRGMKVNIGKTKLLVSGKKCREPTSSGQYPCAVCSRGVGANSIYCTSCRKWCHKRCSGLSSFAGITDYTCPVCSGALQQPAWIDESIVVDSGTIEEVSEFTYL